MKPKDFFKKIRDDRGPSEIFRDKLTRSLMEHMRTNPLDPLPQKTSASWRKGLVVSFAVLVILFTGAIGTVFAAQQALPGDALYGIKLATDQLSIDITQSPAVRINVANRRIEEIKQALTAPSANTAPVQAGIQSALRQYQSVLQGATIISPRVITPSSTPISSFYQSDDRKIPDVASTSTSASTSIFISIPASIPIPASTTHESNDKKENENNNNSNSSSSQQVAVNTPSQSDRKNASSSHNGIGSDDSNDNNHNNNSDDVKKYSSSTSESD
jgi:hypothetical protein